tara:strand:- start:71798 stop:71983 length:186 start_codon:yes stop_codon:yes gene_type:complete
LCKCRSASPAAIIRTIDDQTRARQRQIPEKLQNSDQRSHAIAFTHFHQQWLCALAPTEIAH